MNLVSFLAVGFGAFAGAIARWLLGLVLNPILPALPLGTLAANLVGALVMGMALGAFAHYETLPVAWRLAITTGFLGGLTTFSTFSGETVTLMLEGAIYDRDDEVSQRGIGGRRRGPVLALGACGLR